jgi:nicotinamide mononucleotide adenylyltransferase
VAFSNSDWVRQLFESKVIKIGKKLEIFKNKFNGTNVRNLIVENDKKLYNLVPKEVITLMEKFNGIERMKHLGKNPEKRE